MAQEAVFLDSAGRAQMGIGAGDNAELVGVHTQALLQAHAVRQHLAYKPRVGPGWVIETGDIVYGLLFKRT